MKLSNDVWSNYFNVSPREIWKQKWNALIKEPRHTTPVELKKVLQIDKP